MTFVAPALLGGANLCFRLPGHASSVRVIGGDGLVAVSAARVSAETQADAALLVRTAVQERWSTLASARGPLQLASWTAQPDRVLIGARGKAGLHRWPPAPDGRGSPRESRYYLGPDGELYRGPDDDEPGGSAGVREPRRPLPGPGSLHAAAELPAE